MTHERENCPRARQDALFPAVDCAVIDAKDLGALLLGLHVKVEYANQPPLILGKQGQRAAQGSEEKEAGAKRRHRRLKTPDAAKCLPQQGKQATIARDQVNP